MLPVKLGRHDPLNKCNSRGKLKFTSLRIYASILRKPGHHLSLQDDTNSNVPHIGPHLPRFGGVNVMDRSLCFAFEQTDPAQWFDSLFVYTGQLDYDIRRSRGPIHFKCAAR